MELMHKKSFFLSVTKRTKSVQRLLYIMATLILVDIVALCIFECRMCPWTRIAVLYFADQNVMSRYFAIACLSELVCLWWSHYNVMNGIVSIGLITLIMLFIRQHMVQTVFATTVRLCCVMIMWHVGAAWYMHVRQSSAAMVIESIISCIALVVCIYWVHYQEDYYVQASL